MAIYMNYNDIPGDVTAEGHEKWIELFSFQFAVARSISHPTGAAADRESSAPSVAEIVVTKASDTSSVKLLTEGLKGEGQTVKIDFVKTDASTLEPYLQITLTNCMVSGHSTSSSGDRPSETLTLNFTEIEYKNIGMGEANQTGTPESVKYSSAKAKVL
jgi:type VI secretion system secreted protein Hcp